MTQAHAYIRDPSAIYEKSFAIIRDALFARGTPETSDVAIRMIHACGMVDLVDDLKISDGAEDAGQKALMSGAAIYCDAEMVARGIIGRAMPKASLPQVTLNRPEVRELAQRLGTTRSAAAVEFWRDGLEGAIIAIGNAPTALFHLLDGLAQGWPKPALIIGVPVGFVGAAEAKDALHQGQHGVPYITVLGRRGGSAMAAAAVNGLSLGTSGDGT
jgi:precorrin-8X/cobalt-precorrin-8 methylmutase